jgi:hypothetical protein
MPYSPVAKLMKDLIVAGSIFLFVCNAFSVQPLNGTHQLHALARFAGSNSNQDAESSTTRQEIEQELSIDILSKGSHAGVFQIDQLVHRLTDARQSNEADSTVSRRSGKQLQQSATPSSNGTIELPLYVSYGEDNNMVVPVGGLFSFLLPEPPYVSIQFQVNKRRDNISFLLDTLCPCIVVRPSDVDRCNLPMAPFAMDSSGAGGTTERMGMIMLTNLRVGSQSFGSTMLAAVQEIDVLPSKVDGIMGLSFLNQFALIELDFEKERVTFRKEANRSTSGRLTVLAQAPLQILPELGYTVDVFFDGKGPVNMLVGTGVPGTLLNWKGIANLGLSRDSKSLQRIGWNTGIVEIANVAKQLTHRLAVSSLIQLGDKTMGLPLRGKRLFIGVGTIPLPDGVGGILGMNVLMKCSVCRFEFQENPKISLLSADN